MYLISHAIYSKMAQNLREEVADLGYFAGVIESSALDDQGAEVEYRLVVSLIIYRQSYTSPDCYGDVISNIVPVWSECHTIVDGEGLINDFDFEELKYLLCSWE